MKLKYDFVINNVAGSTVAVPVGSEERKFNGYVRLNETGAVIFKLLQKGAELNELVDALGKEYPNTDKKEIEDTVNEFVNNLKESDVLSDE